MNVKELNALLGKLQKADPNQEVILGIGTPFGPQWLNPTVVQGKDGIYVIPEEARGSLEEQCERQEIGECLTKFHQESVQQRS